MKDFIIFFILTVVISVASSALYVSYKQSDFGNLASIDQKIGQWIEDNPEKIVISVDNMYEKERSLKMQKIVRKAKDKYGTQVINSDKNPFVGQSDSENVLVGIVDYSCFYCKMVRDHPEELTGLISDLKFVVVPVTIMGGDRSKLISKYSIGVFMYNREKFHDFHTSLFSLTGEINKDKLDSLLQDIEIDPENFASFLEEKTDEIENQIVINDKFFAALHVGTPAFLYDETLFIGTIGVSELFSAITGDSLSDDDVGAAIMKDEDTDDDVTNDNIEEEFFVIEEADIDSL